jgi:hypothetical protein
MERESPRAVEQKISVDTMGDRPQGHAGVADF